MAKKYPYIVFLSLLTAKVYAQNGRLLLEAGGGYNKRKISNDTGSFYKPATLNYYDVSLRVGYRLARNWVGGIILEHGKKDYLQTLIVHSGLQSLYYTGKINATTQTYGLFCRHTHFFNQWIFVYGQAEAAAFTTKVETETPLPYPTIPVPADRSETPTEPAGFAIRLFPAVGLNIIHGWGLDLSIGGLEYNRTNNNYDYFTKTVTITLGQQFNMGIHKFIGNNKKK